MRILNFSILLFSLSISAQIELKIDAISSKDSIPTERKFIVNYHIENLTDQEVIFSLYPTSIETNRRASMSKGIAYKLYQDQDFLDLEGVFSNTKVNGYRKAMLEAKTKEEKDILVRKYLEEQKKINLDSKSKIDENEWLLEKGKNFSKSIIILQPKEKRSYSKTLVWNKTRYYKIEENEYYLDEHKPHYIEFSINLMKEYFKDYVEAKEYQEIVNNPRYIKGWFTSNKVEIDFKD